jgi:hypothetical protein
MFDPKNHVESAGGSNISKILDPGEHYARIVDLYLDVPPYDNKSYNIMVMLEGLPQPDGFEGLAIDAKNPSMGKFKGQVARVRSGKFSFSDFTTNKGEFISRDEQMFRWLNFLATGMGVWDKVVASGKTASTIEDYTEVIASFVVDPELWGFFTIGGQEYTNNNGYKAWRLFFPKGAGKAHPFAYAASPESEPLNFISFNASEHLEREKSKDASPQAGNGSAIGGFGGQAAGYGLGDSAITGPGSPGQSFSSGGLQLGNDNDDLPF